MNVSVETTFAIGDTLWWVTPAMDLMEMKVTKVILDVQIGEQGTTIVYDYYNCRVVSVEQANPRSDYVNRPKHLVSPRRNWLFHTKEEAMRKVEEACEYERHPRPQREVQEG